MLVETVKNSPIDSNCYVIHAHNCPDCLIIDPGTEDCNELLSLLNKKRLIPQFIILTHEHFDHIWGVNKLLEIYQPSIICSEQCSEAIKDKKKNLSIFYNNVGFEINNNCKFVFHKEIQFGNQKIEIIDTPGHSLGSISVLVKNLLFTGDTVMMESKIVTKLPGGNKKKLIDSINSLQSSFMNQNIKVYPGHGNAFSFDEFIPSNLI